MPSNPLHTSVKEGPLLTAPTSGFALNAVHSWPGCANCSGRMLLEVTNDTKTVVGYLESDYLWTFNVPDEPDAHPSHPHYVMEWFALDVDKSPIPEIDATQSLHFAASALLRRHDARQN